MISQSTIDAVRQAASLEEIVDKYSPVKKHTCCCPVHQEKTPSFHIYHDENYKCFGCGISGDVFSFIQAVEGKPFDEAVQHLADIYHIPVQYEKTKDQSPEKKNEIDQARKLLNWAQGKYQQALRELPSSALAIQYLQSRGISQEQAIERGYGFAPDRWDFLKNGIIEQGWHELGVKTSLITSQDGKNYDFHRNRIILPLQDTNGRIIGFAGRSIDPKDPSVKYLNPREGLLYQKKKFLYGLHRAQRAIRQPDPVTKLAPGYLYLTEGYFDCDTLYYAGIRNVVATSGTEIDTEAVRLIARYTRHMVLCYDGDPPGQNKMSKHIDLFLQHGFKVEMIALPDGKDPDEYIRAYEPEEIDDSILE